MALDPWFSTYDSTCQIVQEIAEKIQQQNQYERNGENTIRKLSKNRMQNWMPYPLSSVGRNRWGRKLGMNWMNKTK
uniref:Uncharacterized protein n=1 Tax=Neovison vison TaxID=452646 RepID=A0A8C7C0B2_NEOVI